MQFVYDDGQQMCELDLPVPINLSGGGVIGTGARPDRPAPTPEAALMRRGRVTEEWGQ